MSSRKRDYYEVLAVERTAQPDEIKRAYRKLAMQYHPDRNPGDHAAEERFKEATEAYTVLSDPEKRRRYDRGGFAAFESQQTGFEPADFGAVADILEGIFGEVFGGRRRRGRPGRDLAVDLEIGFVEAALGTEKHVTVERPQTCGTCSGSGAAPGSRIDPCAVCQGRGEVRYQRGFFAATRPCTSCAGRGHRIERPCSECHGVGTRARPESIVIRVPPGVEDGAVRTVRGGGEVAPGGTGDLHVTIHVAEHPLFTRDGADVRCTVPISFPQAALGAAVEIPTLDGRVTMKIPAGTQSGKLFRLRGKGVPLYGGAGRGDQLVTVVVEVPNKLTREQRRLVEQLASEMGIEAQPQQATFLDKLRSLFE